MGGTPAPHPRLVEAPGAEEVVRKQGPLEMLVTMGTRPYLLAFDCTHPKMLLGSGHVGHQRSTSVMTISCFCSLAVFGLLLHFLAGPAYLR